MVKRRDFDGRTSRGNIWGSGLEESSRKAILIVLVSRSDLNTVIYSVQYNRLSVKRTE